MSSMAQEFPSVIQHFQHFQASNNFLFFPVYYGTEQLFHGGNDPGCREPLWTARWDTSTDMYRFLSQAIAFRKKVQVWNYPQVQRYSTDGFYAFTRGKTFVALTNQESYISEPITYHDYSDGTKLCDL